MATSFVENALLRFNTLTKKPEKFLSDPSGLLTNIHDSIKTNYDFSKSEEQNKNYNSLRELIVKDFDVEQIWQQIELQNDKLLDVSLHHVCKLVAAKETSLWFNIEENNENESDSEKSSNEFNSEDRDEEIKENGDDINNDEQSLDANDEAEKSSDENTEGEEESIKTVNKNYKKGRESIVDDDFFKLDDMEKFLRNEEREKTKKNNNDSDESDEESVDLFDADDDSGDDEDSKSNPKYSDFFKDDTEENPEEKNSDDKDDSELELEEKEIDSELELEEKEQSDKESEEEEIVQEKKSSLEIREERLKKKIGHIEDNAMKEKSWQLKGEITASNRPHNSLLEEFVEFDLTTRPAPVITQETTYKLEDVIRQRIKDKAFDSVERKIKAVEAPKEYRKKLVLEEEKSKQSLAQIYENEYLKQKEALDPEAADKDEPEPKEHTEIKTLMKSLFAKLDALSNFHFTPKAVVPELKVVNNLPAISMEEVAPVSVSDAALLAPEEIKNKPKGDIIGRGERTDTDKKRERRQKKQKQKKHAVEKEKKDQLTLQNGKFNKKKAKNLLDKVMKDRNVDKMNENSKALKSSTAFFTQLEEEVKGHIKSTEKRKHKLGKKQLVAKKIKL